jgi:hypothetical protein
MGLSRWDIVSVWASAQGDFTVSWVATGNCHISIVASGAHKGKFCRSSREQELCQAQVEHNRYAAGA